MIRAVIFDCFGVLYLDPAKSFYESVLKNYHEIAHELAELDKQYDYGLISADEHAEVVAEIGKVSLEVVKQNIRSEHNRNQVLLDYTQTLRPIYKLGMISNIGSHGMDSFFSADERKELFDEVVLSSDVGVIKPSVEIFEIMAERLGVHPYDCVMIDDRLSNCEGAERAGMRSIHHISNASTMRQLNELVESANA